MCLCNIPIVSKSELKEGIFGIPIENFLKKDFASLLGLAFCMNDQKVIATFKSKTGLDIDGNDLPILVNAHRLGNDIKSYGVNFMDVLDSISFTQTERDNASCKVNLIR